MGLGDNSEGQLSDGSTTGRLSPAQILPGTTWMKVSAGEKFVIAQKQMEHSGVVAITLLGNWVLVVLQILPHSPKTLL
ncbi:hypothetical protein H9X57_04985 [Flavobacterium piscinae]|uniref:hypothetical protein n=1 Tax=Flavobacterium piscinae TaxID=2506424 RepID=UPI0019BBAA8D|nr:hypothetical protein [Flavobacterium piscinae]MBC8882975.1 hypothetical protein [Flavobacterium piscinae]